LADVVISEGHFKHLEIVYQEKRTLEAKFLLAKPLHGSGLARGVGCSYSTCGGFRSTCCATCSSFESGSELELHFRFSGLLHSSLIGNHLMRFDLVDALGKGSV